MEIIGKSLGSELSFTITFRKELYLF